MLAYQNTSKSPIFMGRVTSISTSDAEQILEGKIDVQICHDLPFQPKGNIFYDVFLFLVI